ncbi:hypothetical protein M407DRAFT_20749 [Tulasnella calospora MUT 4182]|uniref:Uncharacterized protein n=1 Tax=Tulasnella calospora MUT 4182 TaxID=1051891 RepID=A0A0C3M8N9_9AGAM|nr:hypothetical protein M407DRAFT_20749 [Tulasnella calospora MUT 4182]
MRMPLWLQNLFPETVGRFSLAKAITNTLGDFYGSLEPEIDFSLKDSTANPSATAGSTHNAGVPLSSKKEDSECSDADGEGTPLPLNTNGKHDAGVWFSSEKEDGECSSDADGEDTPLVSPSASLVPFSEGHRLADLPAY